MARGLPGGVQVSAGWPKTSWEPYLRVTNNSDRCGGSELCGGVGRRPALRRPLFG
jgi:hypothetical protein